MVDQTPPSSRHATDIYSRLARLLALLQQMGEGAQVQGEQGQTQVDAKQGKAAGKSPGSPPAAGDVAAHSLEQLLAELEAAVARQGEVLHSLRQDAEDAQCAVASKNDLLAALSHQTRTAMNGVMGMTELALETALTLEQREYLEQAQYATKGLLTFLEEIIELSIIESYGLELSHESFQLSMLLKAVCHTYAPMADAKSTSLTTVIHPKVPAKLKGDPARLRQVLHQLVSNALSLTEKGQVEVEVRVVEPEPQETPPEEEDASTVRLLFIVRDTGKGIPLERAVTIFDKVATSGTPGAPQAVSLGLPLSKRLLQAMGGHIWVDSGEGEGSWFCFTARFDKDEIQGTAN